MVVTSGSRNLPQIRGTQYVQYPWESRAIVDDQQCQKMEHPRRSMLCVYISWAAPGEPIIAEQKGRSRALMALICSVKYQPYASFGKRKGLARASDVRVDWPSDRLRPLVGSFWPLYVVHMYSVLWTP